MTAADTMRALRARHVGVNPVQPVRPIPPGVRLLPVAVRRPQDWAFRWEQQ